MSLERARIPISLRSKEWSVSNANLPESHSVRRFGITSEWRAFRKRTTIPMSPLVHLARILTSRMYPHSLRLSLVVYIHCLVTSLLISDILFCLSIKLSLTDTSTSRRNRPLRSLPEWLLYCELDPGPTTLRRSPSLKVHLPHRSLFWL